LQSKRSWSGHTIALLVTTQFSIVSSNEALDFSNVQVFYPNWSLSITLRRWLCSESWNVLNCMKPNKPWSSRPLHFFIL